MLLRRTSVDPHFHMDATLSYGLPASTRAARCSRALAWGELKPTLTGRMH